MKHFFTILGGMGTIATESYVRLINHRVKISKDQDYLNYILVNDAQIPDRTAYIKDHTKENFFFALKDDVEKQSLLKPDFFVMPCNTAHYFYHDLAALTDIPFLNMMDIAVHHFMEKFPKEEKIGLIATEGSIFDKLYENSIVKNGRKVELGGNEIQPLVNELIYSDIKENGYVDGELYHRILRKMHDDYGCNVILLGCTELSLAQEKAPNHPYNVIDPQSILADVTIELALKIRNGMDVNKAVSKYLYQD
ncbi:amino acid racemase [Lactobacillus mulieris]|jgi:aspartate racemase|uniref:Amino acid racemase n=1 Tax=Lactobacillus mulieris TaxID=2508708 RepID=A0AAP3M3I2_9LACO|nr:MULTISPECIES: amino acid racemase [Lactobacillus]EEU21005.1 aspartate racemase [Lactobacillus jensenii 27-2-CHN]EEX23330.1 aspartate racemase [Lactobacillus jensenii 115-3-CHN]EFH30357.1 aspartate racemase [Lactobacillus jensenii JV-V16]KAA9245128.1 amino acid racemase [Lactobacillus jensenii]KAA9366380.1 amino acid racemase [Lactobacillus jensenii]